MRRLIDETDQSFERALLRSAGLDVAPEDGARTAMASLLAAAAAAVPTAAAPTAPPAPAVPGAPFAGQGATTGAGTMVAWKWLGIGAVLGSMAGAGAVAGYQQTRVASPSGGASVDLRRADTPAEISATALPAPSETPASARAPNALLAEEQSPAPAPVLPSAPQPVSALPTGTPSASRPRAAAGPAVSSAAHAETPPQPIAESASTLAAEALAIERARRALAAGSPSQAIELLDRYEQNSPTHALAPDALALRIHAEKARGNDAVARKLAERFLASHPNDPHAERVRRVLSEP